MAQAQGGFWRSARRWFGTSAAPATHDAGPTTRSAASLQIGDMLGGYRIVRRLGQGGSGTIYVAVDPRTGLPLALKTLPLAAGIEPDEFASVRDRFLREAAAACRLHHTDIVKTYGAGEQEGYGYIAMEALSGSDLTRYTRPARLLPEPVALRIGARVADALAYAHDLGVVHRDVKPANVMVDLAAHQVKVTDFGIAHLADAQRTRSGQVLGTPSFMSPEQLAGAHVDGRSDVYSLAVMLFQLFTGRMPYEASSMGQLLKAIASSPPLDAQAVRPSLPRGLADVLARALQKTPDERYIDARALGHALRGVEHTAWPSGDAVDTSRG